MKLLSSHDFNDELGKGVDTFEHMFPKHVDDGHLENYLAYFNKAISMLPTI